MSQKQIVLEELRARGAISRNWCLQNYITRLAAIIHTLKKEGYKFIEQNCGKGMEGDYIYHLAK